MNSYGWERGFPAVYWHTSISFLKKCPGFHSAKCGDFQAARAIVNNCIKQQRIEKLRVKYPDAVLLPVITNNKLPIALAQAIGLEVCTCASVLRDKQQRQMNAMERLLCQPEFAGVAPQRYILVDDIVVQGGTIGALRKHVIDCGGTVEAVVALACSFGGEKLMPRNENVRLLEAKFGSAQIRTVLKEYFFSDSPFELTNFQIEYLLRFNDIDSIVKKARQAIGHSPVLLQKKVG